MAKVYISLGSFLLGASISGLISYSSLLFPRLRQWGLSLMLLTFLIFILVAVCDDYIIACLRITRKAFIFSVVGISLSLIFGGLIQWR